VKFNYLNFSLFFFKFLLFIFVFKLNEMLLYNDNDLANHIAKFYVIDKRKNSLEMMKDGFDMADCLTVIIIK